MGSLRLVPSQQVLGILRGGSQSVQVRPLARAHSDSCLQQDVPEPEAEPLFEVAVIPGKGRGLVARVDVAQGTRILCEELLLIAPCQPPEQLERVLASKLKAMPKDKQRQFLSLHNNHPGRHAFGGIVRTNALPCGPGSPIGGVYPTISLINHSCLPNSHNNWNGAAEHETIHATRLIKRGEEITISYEEGKLSADRRQFLKDSFGFLCECPLCNLPPAEVKASDDRRRLIQRLDDRIGNPSLTDPNRGLRDCRLLLETLRAEYGDGAAVLIGRLYYDAFQLSVMHMAEARARIFAERGYETRVICEGEDSPETQRIKALAATPSDHRSFGILSSKLRKEVAPKGLGEEEFETWLFGERS